MNKEQGMQNDEINDGPDFEIQYSLFLVRHSLCTEKLK